MPWVQPSAALGVGVPVLGPDFVGQVVQQSLILVHQAAGRRGVLGGFSGTGLFLAVDFAERVTDKIPTAFFENQRQITDARQGWIHLVNGMLEFSAFYSDLAQQFLDGKFHRGHGLGIASAQVLEFLVQKVGQQEERLLLAMQILQDGSGHGRPHWLREQDWLRQQVMGMMKTQDTTG